MGNDPPVNSQPASYTKATEVFSFRYEKQQQKIALLEKQLAWEKLRVEALDTMIHIAEKQLDITIRKSLATNSLRN